jgi:cell division protein FtsQ
MDGGGCFMPAVKSYSHTPTKRKKVQRTSVHSINIRRLRYVIIVLSVSILFIIGYVNFLTLSTGVSQIVGNSAAYLGFRLEDVVVEGRMRTDKDQILKTLELERGKPLLAINLPDSKAKLEDLSWVKAVRIERRFPDTLVIRISEKDPVALWQNKSQTYLLDRDGELVEIKEPYKYKELLIVTGGLAPKHVGELMEILEKFPEVKARVTAATHLRSTRWDIRLDDKIDVRLPEKEIEKALVYLIDLEKHHKISDRDIMTIDMRLPGQLIFRLTPAAVQTKNKGKDA